MDEQAADVIIVGAGAAGLAAAAMLARHGRRVLLLEARERVGGRIWTQHPPGWPGPVELGAEFVHGGNPALWSLICQAGLSTRPAPQLRWIVRDGERRAMPDAWDRIEAVMRRIGPQADGSFGDWLQGRSPELAEGDRALAVRFVEGFHGAPVGRMSVRTLRAAAQAGEEEQLIMSGGYDGVLAALSGGWPADRVTLRLRTPVAVVNWRSYGVEVLGAGGRWRARAAIFTVPLGVLQARPGEPGAIAFAPAIPAKAEIWTQLEVGHARRLVFRLRDDAWTDPAIPAELREDNGRRFGFLQSDDPVFPVWWSEAPLPLLVGWCGGPRALNLVGEPPLRVMQQARRALAVLLGCGESAVRRLVLDWRMHDWTGDPFARGAYTFSAAGAEDGPARLAEPVEQTLFFAGEATADPLTLGTVHGALASGERAAAQVLGLGATPG